MILLVYPPNHVKKKKKSNFILTKCLSYSVFVFQNKFEIFLLKHISVIKSVSHYISRVFDLFSFKSVTEGGVDQRCQT